MAVNDVFTCQVQYIVQDKKCTINLAYKQTAGPDSDTIAFDVADAWNDRNMAAFLECITGGCAVQCIYVLRILPAAGIPGILNLDSIVGLATGSAMPNDSPYVYKLRTDAITTKKNGRVYITGVSADDVAAGVLSAAFVAGDAATFGVRLQSTMTPISDPSKIFTPVVVNRVAAGVPLVPVQSSTVNLAVLRVDIFSQRRRRTPRTAQS